MLKNNQYTVASFFSGVGGFDYGFHKNNFTLLFGNDDWEDAAKSFEANYPNVFFFEKKIQNLSKEEINSVIKDNKVDVLIGGPPCQCFTRLNNNLLIKQLEEKKRRQ